MENPGPDDNFWSRRRWLARLALSFLIVGLYLVYAGYRGGQSHTLSTARIILCYISAMLCFVMFAMGVRARHGKQ